jgi:saxitoxin biosynthesis operon SxtJ-like protein
MIASEIKQLKTGSRELRKFGLLVGGVFTALGVVSWLRHKPAAPWLLTPGVLLMVFGLLAPRTLKYIYLAWMSLAIVLGFVVSNILLTVFFFVVITPIGFIARCSGKDFLGLKLDSKAASYWLPREKKLRKPEEYERQF